MSDRYIVYFGTHTIEYELFLLPRQTLAITVDPNLSVIVKAPEGSDLSQIQQIVRQRAGWIRKQQRQYEIYLPDLPPRQYLSGESYRFLGRQYRLKVKEISVNMTEQVQLSKQFLEIYTHDKRPDHVRELVNTWYNRQAHQIFQDRLSLCYRKFAQENIQFPSIVIRRMKSSWGSCSKKGIISLNIKLVQLPKEYIDYVLTHELCHLKQLNHGEDFYGLLSRMMPNWQEKKEKLDQFDFG
jgi:predicted metal-dependent hydrolase